MICPKCKKQIPEKSLKCSYCNAKIATLCKKCRAYNSIYNLNCVNCGNQLLKVCPACKSVNLPNAASCRKCGYEFIPQQPKTQNEITNQKVESLETPREVEQIEEEVPQKEEPVAEQSFNETAMNVEKLSQQAAKEVLVNAVLGDEKKIISINGEKGVGKSIVVKSAIHELKNEQMTWLLGECTPITQLSPLGLIQDTLLTFFNITNFCSDNLKLKKDSQRFFQSEFPSLTNEEIFSLLNFLYPTDTCYFEEILHNKHKTFEFLTKVFKTIFENSKTIIVIDNFDLIDGTSYEFLHKLLNTQSAAASFKFVLTYNEIRPVRGYLYNNSLKDKAYLDITLNSFDTKQMDSFISQYFNQEVCPEGLKRDLFKYSAGNPAILEQFVSLVIDFKAKNNSFNINLPSSFDDVVKERLDYLSSNPAAFRLLCVAVIQGLKFYPAIINQILGMEENEFNESLIYLQKANFINQIGEFSFAFKNSLLWNSLLDAIKQREDFPVMNESLYSVYSNYVLSSNSIMAVIAQNLNQNLMAFNIWTQNMKLASAIGDTNLYVISQKQCLSLLEKVEISNSETIKNNIYERLGKLLTKINPNEAKEFLPNAIANAGKFQETYKQIELTGYLASCCMSLGDYHGTIECIDSVISKVDSGFELEIAMLKSRKLDSLLKIGNSGEIVNMTDNEILPVFDKYLNSKPHKNIPIGKLYKAWLQTYLNLANALVFQGDCRSFEVISTMFELFEKNNFDDKLFICKTKLALAFANTIKGDIESSEKILEEIIKVYKTDIMDNEAISRWNLINIINNFMHKKYSGLKEELFQVVSFAHNINDNFTKNVLKTLLGKIFTDEQNAKRALDIYSEQITYFAKAKNAIGALLAWGLIAEVKLIIEGPDKSLEVSQKALDVAQSPKINNYTFAVLLNKIIAEAFMAKSDYESAKVYIERGILIARKFELMDFLSDLYLLYGKYLQDIALIKAEAKVEYIKGSAKMYKKAGLIAQSIKNNYLLAKIAKAKTVLSSFCELNDIPTGEIE